MATRTRQPARPLPAWCGYCDAPDARFMPSGSTPGAVVRCPVCHPAMVPGGRLYKAPPPMPVPIQDRMALAIPEADR